MTTETISRPTRRADPVRDATWSKTLQRMFGEGASTDPRVIVADLYQQHADDLLAFLGSRTENPELAADLMQEAYLRLLARNRDDEEEEIGDDREFLFFTARNLLAEARESAAWRSPDDEELYAYEPPAAPAEPDRLLQNRQTVARMYEHIRRLPVRCREAFVLHKFYDLTYPEIASRMRVSVSAVEKQLIRAREHFSSLS